MALSKLKYNSLNVTAAAGKAVGFDSGADDLAGISGGSMVFIKKLTASSSDDLSFVHGSASVVLDSTYKEYLFTFKNIHPSADTTFQFNGSIDAGSNYNVAKTGTIWDTYHPEDDTSSGTRFHPSSPANSTDFFPLNPEGTLSNYAADENSGGYLRLYNPSSTTFVKHFEGMYVHNYENSNISWAISNYHGGYFNTTSDIDAIQFKMASGTIDAGDICLYGIS